MKLNPEQQERVWKWCGREHETAHDEWDIDDVAALLKWVPMKLAAMAIAGGGRGKWIVKILNGFTVSQGESESLSEAIIEAVWPLVEQEER